MGLSSGPEEVYSSFSTCLPAPLIHLKQVASHYHREAFNILEGVRLSQMSILAQKGLRKMLSTRRLLVAQPF